MARTFPETLPDIANVAAALGDPSRAAMCAALMNGLAWTATELGTYTGLGAPTVSKHIDTLVEAGIVDQIRQGRHRYIRLASEDVAHVIEGLGSIAQTTVASPQSLRAARRNDQIRKGRTCYKHLAGQLGVGLADQLRSHRYLRDDWRLTGEGATLISSWGLGATSLSATPCLDSTERRFHLAGDLGRQLCAFMFTRDWIQRIGTTRAVKLTARGQDQLAAAGLRPLDYP